jgi:1-acyl-sn-glycerol-3-phosphate acyltransferase
MLVLAVVTTLLLPVILIPTAIIDLTRSLGMRTPSWALSRLALFGWFYLVTEVAALGALLALGLVTGFGLWKKPFVEGTFALQTWWAHQLFAGFRTLFGATVEVEGESAITPGPVLVFMRHASIADVLLPNVIVTRRHGLRLRYVLKRELLIDPAIDIAGNRLPNYFVRRGSADAAGEIERVASLTDGLGGGDGVIIYPEGTRFSTAKRDRVLEKLRRSKPGLAARAERLHHTLPPRFGGPSALLDTHTPADVVFMTHVGFDGLAEVRDLLGGGLVRTRIQVAFWRVPYAEIPTGRDERLAWLFEQWERVDRWIGERKGSPA